jgi:hypothetical protein
MLCIAPFLLKLVQMEANRFASVDDAAKTAMPRLTDM